MENEIDKTPPKLQDLQAREAAIFASCYEAHNKFQGVLNIFNDFNDTINEVNVEIQDKIDEIERKERFETVAGNVPVKSEVDLMAVQKWMADYGRDAFNKKLEALFCIAEEPTPGTTINCLMDEALDFCFDSSFLPYLVVEKIMKSSDAKFSLKEKAPLLLKCIEESVEKAAAHHGLTWNETFSMVLAYRLTARNQSMKNKRFKRA